MAKPRRATAEAFYDVFADFTIEDQAAALKILEQVHRLKVREMRPKQARHSPPDPAISDRAAPADTAQLPLVGGGGGSAAEGNGQQKIGGEQA